MAAKFITSAVEPSQYPPDTLPEIAFAGRSNAGKSTLINSIMEAPLARTSSTPGKTNLLNFFNVNGKYCLVDMPGYGFSKRSGDEQATWSGTVETYLRQRDALVAVVIVVDSRRIWEDEERMLVRFLKQNGLPVVIAVTKMDKHSRAEAAKIMKAFEKIKCDRMFFVAAEKNQGVEELEDFLFREYIKPQMKK